MSRIAPLAPLLALTAAGPAEADATPESLVAGARERLAVVDRECERGGRTIVVCARRNANDRYRLPFVGAVPGDPDNESVMAERVRLQANPGTCQPWALFRAFCGGVGVSVGVGGQGVFAGGGLRRAQ